MIKILYWSSCEGSYLMHANQNQVHLRMSDELLKHQIKLLTFSIETPCCVFRTEMAALSGTMCDDIWL